MGDERGVATHQLMQLSDGLEVTITNVHHQKYLSVNSGVGMMSLHNVKNSPAEWPLVLTREGDSRKISMEEKCAILGDARWRNAALVPE